MLVPVVLAGGSGTRLWPLSRQQFPKQFLKLFGNESMLQQTLLRLNGFPDLAEPIVVCNEEHRFAVAEQLQQIKIKGSILLEPTARNTAPAIALAALHAKQVSGENPTLLVLPADHLIKDIKSFHSAIERAVESANNGNLVTFGIVPNLPEIGYGYIKCAKSNAASRTIEVEKFVEKPDLQTAEQYLAEGSYLWNSGMFVFKANDYLNALSSHGKECFDASQSAYSKSIVDLDFLRINSTEFSKSPNISVDYAVMECASNVHCVPLKAGWSDVGCWRSYWEAQDKDENGNSIVGDAITVSTKNTLIYSQDKLVATIGLDNIVVINTADAVLVIDKTHAQSVKQAIEFLIKADRTEHITHREVQRPWGSYDSIDFGERFQVKRITVKPGASLSLQMHHHRAEHWTVVTGTALVQVDEKEILLSENESTYIPLGVKHRLSNPGKMPLELIEVQSGAYLGEDDIVRFEDTYNRA